MHELGFIIDKEGKISFFGEWLSIEKMTINNRKGFHTFSFEDDIEDTDYFKDLKLTYDKTLAHWFNEEAAIQFSAQGLVILRNISVEYENEEMCMHTPKNLTNAQKDSLSLMYEVLKNFVKSEISVVGKDCSIEEEFLLIDDYFDAFQIDRESNLSRG